MRDDNFFEQHTVKEPTSETLLRSTKQFVQPHVSRAKYPEVLSHLSSITYNEDYL